MDIIKILHKIVENPKNIKYYEELKQCFSDSNTIEALEFLVKHVNNNNIKQKQ